MKSQDDILLEQAYSKIFLKENEDMNTYTPYNDKDEMIKKINEVLPSLDAEDLQHIYDQLFED